ncbi:hypothetical protein DK389_27045 [Methylobacterium durans]|uniref:Uncharacterized protein n=1 Tax=Methylobacterium durans TaxID=2202825 RepID=A0A2U8WDV4_9HYPH|nr:hypothetical protein DK389_27045 [Methylobacterium durans]
MGALRRRRGHLDRHSRAAGAGQTFTPNEGLLGFGSQVGNILRVGVTFTDGDGHLETVFSAPTGVVGDNWNGIPS